MLHQIFLTLLFIASLTLSACRPAPDNLSPIMSDENTNLNILATAPFLAEIAQNVAGSRIQISSLIPSGVDPHGFEASPSDVAKVSESQVLIINGAGFEEFIESLLDNADGERLVIEAAAGLTTREEHEDDQEDEDDQGHDHEEDPHFWLDPNNVIHYVNNIRDGLIAADPDGAVEYAANAEKYIEQLRELDSWISSQIQQIPQERRLLITNHDYFGYYADRYGFKVIGTVIPSVTSGASPSARVMAHLIEQVKETGAPAIFLETGANPRLAEQIASETGAKIAPQLYSHSVTGTDGPAPTYIDMMKYNTQVIVEALK